MKKLIVSKKNPNKVTTCLGLNLQNETMSVTGKIVLQRNLFYLVFISFVQIATKIQTYLKYTLRKQN